MASSELTQICVVGLLSDVTFHMAKCCAEDLHMENPGLYELPDIQGLLEFSWDVYIDAKRRDLAGETWVFDEKAIVYLGGNLLGGPSAFLEWAQLTHNYTNFRPAPLYETLAEEAYKNHLNCQDHDYVYMDITIGDEPAGRLVFELFSDTVPKTCENFRALCTGEKGDSPDTEYNRHYKNKNFHRVVKNGWIQGGDIWMKRGNGGESVYGEVFEDENFAIQNNTRGILGMANKGRHSNGSQFYITLQPAQWMDTKYVAFGRVIEGTATLAAMEAQETMNDRPLKEICIQDCGVCTFEF